MIGNVHPTHSGPTEFDKFVSRVAVGADNVNAFALQVGIQDVAGALGRAIGAGVEALLASRAASLALKVVINWAHDLTSVRPGHIPPPGSMAEITSAVEGAIQTGNYTTKAGGLIEGTTTINGVTVGFRGRIIDRVARIATVFTKVK